MIVLAMASRTASAPCPASAGPFFTRTPEPWPAMRGRWSRSVNRVVRSTSVPIAELPSPTMRSPSQCPGTARSVASAGRWLIRSSGVTKGFPRARPRHAQRPPGAQTRRQLTAQRAAPLHIQRLVDGLVADAHGIILGEVAREAPGNLLGAPRPGPPPRLPPPVPAPLPRHPRPADHRAAWRDDHAGQPLLHVPPQ